MGFRRIGVEVDQHTKMPSYFRQALAAVLLVSLVTGSACAATRRKSRYRHRSKPKLPPTTVKAVPRLWPLKPPVKPPVKLPAQPAVGGQFGRVYVLKSGLTFQILGARTSFEPFDDSSQLFPAADQKLLILRVIIKNNARADLPFNYADHQFQIEDSKGNLYGGGNYRLNSSEDLEFSPTLTPGLAIGYKPEDPLEVAISVDADAQITKINLCQGRAGTTEDATSFPIAGTPDGNARNVIVPGPNEGVATLMAAHDWYPSGYFNFRLDGLTFSPGPFLGHAAAKGKRFALLKFTLRNATTPPRSDADFVGKEPTQIKLTGAGGETYTVSTDIGLLQQDADFRVSYKLSPDEEVPLRLCFEVPADKPVKTLTFGAPGGKQWNFDVSAWN